MITMLNICGPMLVVSAIMKSTKNSGAKHKIERQGFVVTKDKRSVSERTISFIKDNFYLLIPGYNLIKSFRMFVTNDVTYAEDRKKVYIDREMLVEKKKKEEKKDLPKAKVPSKKEETVKTTEKADVKKTEKAINPFEGLTLEQLKDLEEHYIRIDEGLRKQYERKVSAHASVEDINKTVRETKANAKLFYLVQDRIKALTPVVPTSEEMPHTLTR